MTRRPWVVLCACLPFIALATSCGGDDDSAAASPGATAPAATSQSATPVGNVATDTTSEPLLEAPASRYSILHEELGANFLLDHRNTYVLDARTYGGTPTFASAKEGEALLNKWGYLGGYETAYEPEGRDTAVLSGRYYIAVESHLFSTASSASQAFTYFEARLRTARAAQEVTTIAIGNEHSAWKFVGEKVPGTSIVSAYHRLIFRRGNLVTIVQTYGSEGFMKVDVARTLAQFVDDKALGQRPSASPTPAPASAATPTLAAGR